MDKEDVAHLHNGILLWGKNNGILKSEGKWMELEIILNEVTQSQKGEHGMYTLIYGFQT